MAEMDDKGMVLASPSTRIGDLGGGQIHPSYTGKAGWERGTVKGPGDRRNLSLFLPCFDIAHVSVPFLLPKLIPRLKPEHRQGERQTRAENTMKKKNMGEENGWLKQAGGLSLAC